MTPDAPSELPTAPGAGAFELATRLSIAVRIEPELLRAMRLAALPSLDVSAEADLWFSRWVRTRGADGIVLLPAVRAYLQGRLAELLAIQPERDRELPWQVLARIHRSTSPALLLEERVAWLVARHGPDAAAAVDEELRRALRALVVEGRTGVADWFGRAWERLPPAARATPAEWQLWQVSADRLPRTRMGVRRDGSNLLLGNVSGAGAAAIMVPDTDPRLLELSPAGRAPTTVAIRAGESSSIPVGPGAVRIRTARGDIYEIASEATGPPPDTIYLIRHAERSADPPPIGSGESAVPAASPFGVDFQGNDDPHSLLPRGWQRSGALAALFDPALGALQAGLQTPSALLSPAYGGPDKAAEYRTYQTLQGLSDRLGLPVVSEFAEGQEAQLAASVVSGSSGVVLICWEPDHIPALAAALPTVPGTVIPQSWQYDRFDVIWTFTRVPGAVPAQYIFGQVPQQLLAGDTDTVVGS